jgi:hypothetical protein
MQGADGHRARRRPIYPRKRCEPALGWIALFCLMPMPSTAEQAVQERVVTGVPACESCEIRVVGRVVLGSMDDPVSPAGQVRAALGGEGEFFVISDQLPLPGVPTYGPNGAFRGVLGRSGEGPGEMGRPWRLGGAADGTLFVYDLPRGAVHVFDPDGVWQRTLRPVVPPIHGPVPVDDSVMVLVPGSARPMEVPDREVVLYDVRTARVLGGVGPIGHLVPGQPRGVTAVAAADGGSMWLVKGASGVVERWTVSGEHVNTLRWEDGWARFARADRRTAAFLGAQLWQDPQSGLLWIVSNSPDPSYVAPPPRPVAPGQPLPTDLLDPASLNARHSPIVSVVDPARGQVLVHLTLDHYVHAVLSDGRMVVMNESETGYQYAEVLQLRLTGLSDRD